MKVNRLGEVPSMCQPEIPALQWRKSEAALLLLFYVLPLVIVPGWLRDSIKALYFAGNRHHRGGGTSNTATAEYLFAAPCILMREPNGTLAILGWVVNTVVLKCP